MNRVAFLSSILWASVGFGGVITEAPKWNRETFGPIVCPVDVALLTWIPIVDNDTIAYIDVPGTVKRMDLARDFRSPTENPKIEPFISVQGQDLGDGYMRFDFRGQGIKTTFKNGDEWDRRPMVALLYDGTAEAVHLTDPAKGIVNGYYWADGDVGIPRGWTYLAVSLESLDAPFGDANQDGRIDITDFGLVKSNLSANPGLYKDGDLNGDGWVQIDDFGLLKQNFGWKQASAVPEPSTLGLLGLGILFLVLGKIVPRVVVR